jgi:hypothetical protein
VKESLYPHLLNYLASAGIKKKVLDELSNQLRSPVSVSMLTEVDLINKSVSKDVPSTIGVS